MELERISACTYPVRDRDLDYTFGLLARVGFTKADLWGGPPNYANDPTECDPAGLKAKAAQHGLRIANLGTYAGRRLLEVGLETELTEMRHAIDQADALGVRSIRVCPGQGEDPAIIPALVPFFRESAAYAAKKGVLLGMENHSGSLAGNPEHCMRLVRQVDDPHFGVLYEPANLMACRVDYQEAYRTFRGHVVHCHVKDSRWVQGRYECTMLGQGEVDLAWLVRTLEADRYRGDYALEYEIEKVVPIDLGLPKWLECFRQI